MLKIAAAHVVAVSSLVAPEACFIAMEMVPDMEALRSEVERHMPPAYVPELIQVTHERERTFLGTFVLALMGMEE